jgi:polar amino acid transport system substrate-binding protein
MNRLNTLATGWIALGAVAIGAASAQADTLEQMRSQGYVRAATANEVPYGYMKPDGSAVGIGPDVAAAVFKSMGVKEINWTVTPFGTLIPGLKAGRFDIAAAEQNVQPDRCKQVAFSIPDSSYGQGLLVKKGNPRNLHTYADIAKDPSLKVAVVNGANNIDYLRAVGVRDSQVVYIKDNADALATVRNRADAYAATELTVFNLARKQKTVEQAEPFTDPVVAGKPVRDYGAFAFRKEDKELLAAFDKALAAFHKTDAYKQILKRYGLSQKSIDAVSGADIERLCQGD